MAHQVLGPKPPPPLPPLLKRSPASASQTKAKRTTVIDDQVDYFESTSNQWLTAEERLAAAQKEEEMLEAKEKARQRGGAYTVDIDIGRGLATMQEKPQGISPAEAQAMREEERKKEEAEWDPEKQEAAAKAMLEDGDEEDGAEECEPPVDELKNVYVSDMYRANLVGDVSPGPEEDEEEDEDLKDYRDRVKNPRILPHPQLHQAIPYTPEDAQVSDGGAGACQETPHRGGGGHCQAPWRGTGAFETNDSTKNGVKVPMLQRRVGGLSMLWC